MSPTYLANRKLLVFSNHSFIKTQFVLSWHVFNGCVTHQAKCCCCGTPSKRNLENMFLLPKAWWKSQWRVTGLLESMVWERVRETHSVSTCMLVIDNSLFIIQFSLNWSGQSWTSQTGNAALGSCSIPPPTMEVQYGYKYLVLIHLHNLQYQELSQSKKSKLLPDLGSLVKVYWHKLCNTELSKQ